MAVSQPTEIAVYCADVGSIPKSKFGWARVCGAQEQTGRDIERLASAIAADVQVRCVALGFECPLFVPLYKASADVLRSRPGEGDRSWSASAGVCSLGAGLVESAWLLACVRSRCQGPIPVFVNPSAFRKVGQGLLLWEAFITGERSGTDEEDALAAARLFQSTWPELSDVMPCRDLQVMSLIGMAALRTGWSEDIELLKEKPYVIGHAVADSRKKGRAANG